MFLFLFFCVSSLTFFDIAVTAGNSPPQSCTAITVSKFDSYFGNSDSNSTVSFDLKLFNLGNATWIHVSKVFYYDSTEYRPDYVCVNVKFYITDPDPQKCSPLNTPFSFALNEPSFELHAHYSGNWYATWTEIFFGYADDGTFSIDDGTFFTPQNPSFSSITSNRNSFTNVTHLCTAFVSAPETPIKKSPKCKSFISETIVLNADKSIYANSTGTYTFTNGNNNMIVAANFTGPNEYYVLFWVNGAPCESKWKNCNSQLFDGKSDGKIIINSAIIKDVGSEYTGSYVPLIGRIVLRENETLMKEGIPFTPSNNCLYSNYKFGDTQFSQNKFCCTEFENV